jgi:myo-inositol-1(or 4)-monophosphatase
MMDRNALYRAFSDRARGLPWSAELATASSVAGAAGAQLLESFGRVTGRPKADGSLITDADLAADQLITEHLLAAFPGDSVLSEEGAKGYAGEHRLWVVDPLDGTSNYCHGVPLWGVSLALVEAGRPVVAVSHFPCLRLSFWAVAGHGAWEDGRRLGTVADPTLRSGDLVTYCSRTPLRFELQLGGQGRMLGCETLNLALVAAGAVHASLAATSGLWDLAAGCLLVEEAGGVIHSLDDEAIWPLAHGDYGRRTFATMAVGNRGLMDVVRAGLRPRSTPVALAPA